MRHCRLVKDRVIQHLAERRRSTPSIASLSWRDFERLICAVFQARGYTVSGFSGAAGGVDLGLIRHGRRFLVHCRHWRKPEVEVTAVRELHGTIRAQGAHGGFLVTGGRFTKEALRYARAVRIDLYDGEALAEMLDAVRTIPRAPAAIPTGR